MRCDPLNTPLVTLSTRELPAAVPQKEVQAVVQYLFLALRQHGEVELPLDRLELRDTIQELLNPVQINSRGDPPERVIALRAAQGGDKIKIRNLHTVFFNGNEHADRHIIDGKDVLVVIVEGGTREHNSHWEAGAKQNFDTGLYKAHTILYIRTEDYGPKPKVGKPLVMDAGTDHKRTFDIMKCEEECGVFRMTLQRTRQ